MEIPFEKLDKKSYGEESQRMIAEWEKQAYELTEQESFRNHVVTKKLAELARGYLEAVTNILSNDETIGEIDRKALLKAKKIHEIYLAAFTKDVSQEIELLKTKVENEI